MILRTKHDTGPILTLRRRPWDIFTLFTQYCVRGAIPTLQLTRDGKAANVCYEGHFANIGWQNVFREHEADRNFIPAHSQAVLLTKQLGVNFHVLICSLEKAL